MRATVPHLRLTPTLLVPQLLGTLLAALLCHETLTVHADEPGLSATTASDAITLFDAGKPILRYQIASQDRDGKWPRANYVHPLWSLDGNPLTEDFPADHGHHRGVFWSWHQTLIGDKSAGDAWICKDFEWIVRGANAQVSAQRAVIRSLVEWQSPDITRDGGPPVSIAREDITITAHPLREASRSIDFEIKINALVPNLKIGGSNDAKGYGGFSVRMKLDDGLSFSSPDGDVKPKLNAIKAKHWINIARAGEGIAILAHPQNPAPRDSWILRAAKSMQNAAFPGRTPVTVSQGEPLHLRYRLVIHDGSLSAQQLDSNFDEYRSTTSARP